MNIDTLRIAVLDIVEDASEQEITSKILLQTDGSLQAAGMTSLAFLVMVELLEARLGIIVDPEIDPESLFTIDGIVAFAVSQLAINDGGMEHARA